MYLKANFILSLKNMEPFEPRNKSLIHLSPLRTLQFYYQSPIENIKIGDQQSVQEARPEEEEEDRL